MQLRSRGRPVVAHTVVETAEHPSVLLSGEATGCVGNHVVDLALRGRSVAVGWAHSDPVPRWRGVWLRRTGQPWPGPRHVDPVRTRSARLWPGPTKDQRARRDHRPLPGGGGDEGLQLALKGFDRCASAQDDGSDSTRQSTAPSRSASSMDKFNHRAVTPLFRVKPRQAGNLLGHGPARPGSAGPPTDSLYAPSVTILVNQDGDVGITEVVEIVGQGIGLLTTELEQEHTAAAQEAGAVAEDTS